MIYEESLIEEIRERNDIVDIISSHVNLKRRGNSYVGLCPFHNEKTPSFSVSRDKQMYYCFGCGAGGNIFTFLMEYENNTFLEALEYLAGRAGIELPKKEMSKAAKEAQDAKTILRNMNKQAANYYYYLLHNERGKKALAYLMDRGLTEETIRKFGLGFADIYSDSLYRYLKSKGYTDLMLKDSGLVTIEEKGAYDKFFHRVIFPIVDANNRVIGFGGRVLGDGQPKYLNSKETLLFDKSRNLYGLNFARSSRKGYFILCEGYMDVIAMHQAGFTNAVAALGTAFTSQQALLLKRFTQKIVVSFDSDGAGVKAALRAIPMLKAVGLSVRVLNLKPYKDPDEFMKTEGMEAFEQRIQEAVSGTMYEIEKLAEQYNQKDPESRTQFGHELAKKLAMIEDPMERGNYIAAAANAYFMKPSELESLVNHYGALSIGKAVQEENREQEVQKRKGNQKEEALNRPQKLLLTEFVEQPQLMKKLSDIISPADFTRKLYRDVAIMLYDQFEESGAVNPARIINQFQNLEEQQEVASLFNATLNIDPLPDDKGKILADIVKKVKNASIEEAMNHVTDVMEYQQLITEKAKLMKLNISL